MKLEELAKQLDDSEDSIEAARIIDEHIKDRIVQAMVAAMPNPSIECTLTGDTVPNFVRTYLAKAWSEADAS